MKWFRFYSEALHDPKVQLLPAETYRGWTQLLCLANETEPRGRLPRTMQDTAYKLHMDMATAESLIAELVDAGLIDRKNGRFLMHNWDVRQPDSDNIASRVQKHREKQKKPVTGNNNVTLHVTPSPRTSNVLDTDTEEKRGDTEKEKEKEERKEDAPTALTLPFVLAYVGKYQGRTAGGRPSPIQHSDLVSIERHYGSELCFQAAEAKGWDKPASYLRGWLNDHAGQTNEPETRDEAIARLGRPSGPSVPDALEDTDRVADGVHGLDSRSLAVARLGRGG